MQRTLIALLLLAFAPAAQAQEPPIYGSWGLIAGESDDINAAIEAAVRKMNFITRPIARRRLRSTNTPYQVVRIAQTDGDVSVSFDDRPPIVGPATGDPVKWRRDDGEVFDVTTRWTNGSLEQTFVAGDGRRHNLFTLVGNDRLDLQVTVTSPQLAAPVSYTLRYRRLPQ